MKEKRIKKILELSYSKKVKLERQLNYWTAFFAGLWIAGITLLFEVINENAFLSIKGIEFVMITVIMILASHRYDNLLSAIVLKEENTTSLKKAKEILAR